jgi:hypothetical protein
MSINNDIAPTDEGTDQQCDDIASQVGSLALEWFGKEDDRYVPNLSIQYNLSQTESWISLRATNGLSFFCAKT